VAAIADAWISEFRRFALLIISDIVELMIAGAWVDVAVFLRFALRIKSDILEWSVDLSDNIMWLWLAVYLLLLDAMRY